MNELQELLERVEKAEGPSKALDISISEAVLGGMPRYDGDDCPEFLLPYTASLDAAVALVEKMLPGWVIQIGVYPERNVAGVTEPEREPFVGVTDQWPRTWRAKGATPALALLAALLRALISQRSEAMNTLLKSDGELY